MLRFFLSIFLVILLPASLLAAPIQTDAKQAVIIDHDTGIVLFEKNARDPMPPASMTKIMTVQMVLEAIDAGDLSEDTLLTISEDAWRRGGAASGASTMFLAPRSEVSVIDLLRGLIIQSGNDAAITFAERLGGSEPAFADMMTQRARELGLDSATFRNATGWPNEEHRISALDLAKLTGIQIERFPDYYDIYAERSFSWNGISQDNRNPLLGNFTGADGVKTGSTSVAGFGLVASAERNGIRRTVVLNGLTSQSERRRVAMELMTAAFDQFSILQLYENGLSMGELPVYLGKSETVGLVIRDTVTVPAHRSERRLIKARIDYVTPTAPVDAGAKLAELIISKEGVELGRYPLYASESVDRIGFFGRVATSLAQKIRG
ncbi:D-alanyl-D-alanine carboxypeptidase family protein [Algimonas porphyrae]|uniref:serine-type D-Ala-D-Ala carboxypeptidase n=1 Tax=Algimonas porphyrae TaxID=1128113 RepID=A0ABQ5UV12_9PROT|nr:D-alanyl-D-alanine carboxypeptidase family protein [Algimonas porphyrae]GLQ19083.1 D-alanyl-D-alanine carboxypeptidase [Algimonas porphyrae]